MCVYHLAIGMTPEEYWYGDLELAVWYRKAHKLKIKTQNEQLWLQGLYNFNAVSTALSNAFRKKGERAKEYMKKPLDLFPEEKPKQEQKLERMDRYLKSWQQNWKQLYGNKNK